MTLQTKSRAPQITAALPLSVSGTKLRFPWLWSGIVALLMCVSLQSQAADVFWTGATDATWTGANWTGGTVTSNTVVYNSQATQNLIQTLGQNWAISGISIVNPAGSITLNAGNTITNSGGIDMSLATVNLTNKAPMVLSAPQSWTVGGSAVLTNSGAINNNGNALTINTIDSTSVVGSPNNTVSGSGRLIKTGNGTLYTGGGSYTGGTFINGGGFFSMADGIGAQWSPVTMTSNSLWTFNGKQAFVGTLTLSNATMGINRNGNYYGSNVVSYGNSMIAISEMRIGASVAGNTYTNIFNVVDGTLTLNINRLFCQNNATGNVVKTGPGTLVISNLSTTAGQVWNSATYLNQGVFQTYFLANSGLPSNLGASSAAATNLVFNGGTLRYTRGAAVVTDRLFSLGTNGGALDASAVGTLSFTNRGAMEFVDSGARTLTLTGTNLGGNLLAVSIGDNGGPTTLVKTGPGCWVLGGTNSYTGGTVLSEGTLLLGGICTMTSETSFNVAAGTTLGITNNLNANLADRIGDNASITLNGGAFKYLTDSSAIEFSEKVGPLAINSGVNSVVVGPAAVGHTSILTFSSLARQGSATVNFQIDNTATTKVFFAQTPALGSWITVNGFTAKYDAVNGLTPSVISGVSKTGIYTGGDVGEGLDLQGTFALAEYYADSAESYTVQNATFTANPSRVNASGAFGNWGGNVANFGPTQNDQNIAAISDVWYEADLYASPNLALSVPTVDQQSYKLQLILHDGASLNRPMKVTIGAQVVEPSINLNALGAGGTSPKGYVISFVFTGDGGDLPIKIESLVPGNSGAILNALTLETVSSTPQQPYVISPLAGQSVLAGLPVQFIANAGGVQLSYVWEKQVGGNWIPLANGAGISGATSAYLTIASASVSDTTNYRYTVTNPAGSATSNPALLNVIPTSPHAKIGHWISGPQNFVDTAGFAPAGTHNGFLVGATETFAWSSDVPAGFSGSSIDLTAGDVAVAISNTSTSDSGYSPTFDGVVANSLTIAFWAKGWPGDWNPFVSKRGENDLGYQLRKNGSALYPSYTIRATTGSDDTTSADLVGATPTQWHHYAGTWDGVTGIRKLYVDNVLAMVQYGDTGPMAPATANKLVLGGRDSGGYGQWCRSKLFDVQIYGYALSEAEVQGINLMTNAPIAKSIVTGPAVGQGADFQGNFALSEYYGNAAGSYLRIGDAYFLPSVRPGGTASALNRPDFGTSADQINLGTLSYQMVAGIGTFTLPAMTAGKPYKLQLFYHDNVSTGAGQRVINVLAGTPAGTNFLGVVDCAAAGANLTNAVDYVLVYTFTGDGNPMTIIETSITGSPILSALSLEDLSPSTGLPTAVLPIASKTAFVGDTVQFLEVVSGSGLTYVWQKFTGGNWVTLTDGDRVSGSTTNILSLSNLTLADAGSYRVTVANTAGSVTSTAQLTVLELSPHAMIGRWLTGSQDLADHSGYTAAGTHNGYLVGTPASFVWSSDVPAGFAGYSADLTSVDNVAIAITNTVTSEPGYSGTFDRGVTNSFSISLWAKGWPSDYYSFISKRGETGMGYSVRAWVNSPVPSFTIGNENMTGSFQIDPATPKWHHYAATRDAATGTRKLYVDGVLAAIRTNDVNPMLSALSDHLVLGARQQDNNYSYWSKVKLYDVQMYGYALSTDAIAGINKITNAPNLLAGPRSQGAFAGDTVQLSANVDGVQLSYKWQKLNGGDYVDIVDGGKFAGSATSTLTIANVSAVEAGDYRITITNPAGVTNSTAKVIIIDNAYQGRIGHWLSGSQSLADVSGFTPAGIHDGMMVGTNSTPVWSSDVPAGFTGYSLDLSAGNAGVLITNTTTADGIYCPTFDKLITNSFSVAVWVKGWPTNIYSPFVSKRGENTPTNGFMGFQVRKWADTAWPTLTIGSNNLYSTILIDTNAAQWHHYVATRDGATGISKIYVDGVLAASTNGFGPMVPALTDHLVLGAKQQDGVFNNWSYSKLFDVQIYDYAVTLAQIEGINKMTNPPVLIAPMLYSKSAVAGDTVQLAVNVSGVDVVYQWQKFNGSVYENVVDGGNISGATSSVLTFANVTVLNGGSYRLNASNSIGQTNVTASLVVIASAPHSLIGRWLSGSQSLADGSGYAPAGIHDGVLVGAVGTETWSADVPANFTGSSLDLSGGDVSVVVTNTATSDSLYCPTFDTIITNGFSVAVWAKGWPAGWASFVSKGNVGAASGFLLRSYDNTDKPTFTVGGPGLVGDLVSTIPVDTNNAAWHHYAATRDGVTGIRKLYIDNVLAATSTEDIGPMAVNSAGHLFLGSGDNSYWSHVKLFDVQVYSYALSAAEIQSINKLAPVTPVTPGPISYSIAGGVLTMNWTNGVLQSTTALAGTNTVWVTEPAISPITINLNQTTGNKFYRVVGQ